MASDKNLYFLSKVTPLFPSGMKSCEYIVSEDFFYPLKYFENESSFSNSPVKNINCDIQTIEEKYSSVDEFLRESDCPTESVCLCVQNLAFVKFLNRVKVRIDSVLFSIIMLELKRSRIFRKNLLTKFFTRYIRDKKIGISNMTCILCNRCAMKFHAIIYLSPPKKNILDQKWNRKVQVLVNEKCELENAMAWLSTLGGAFSALGDTYLKCAERAGAISIQQLYIALRLGDPLTVCRCKIYLAMSLLQRGYYKKTKHIIREQYRFSTEGEGSKDFRLKNMCLAVWNKLRYFLSQRHT